MKKVSQCVNITTFLAVGEDASIDWQKAEEEKRGTDLELEASVDITSMSGPARMSTQTSVSQHHSPQKA